MKMTLKHYSFEDHNEEAAAIRMESKLKALLSA